MAADDDSARVDGRIAWEQPQDLGFREALVTEISFSASDGKLGAMIESIEVTTADSLVALELELGRADIEHIVEVLGRLFGTGVPEPEPPGGPR